jgi:uncharacterized protein YrzB (UPF0473 family)
VPAEGRDGGEEPQPITLIDEAGEERTFRMHDAFELGGVTYYLVEDADEPSEVLLLRDVDGSLETVDGAEFQRVMTALEHDEVD